MAWIRNTGKLLKPFVASRAGEIRNNVKPVQWRHIPTEENVADDVSRGLSIPELSDRWLNGPEFLCQPNNDWPKEDIKPDTAEVERECIRKKTVGVVTSGEVGMQNVINCEDYSSWKRLIRITAWVLKYKNKLRSKAQRSSIGSRSQVSLNSKELEEIRKFHKEESERCPSREDGSRSQASLTPKELEESRKLWIRESQKCLKDRLKKNEFRTLSPFVDEEHIIRVGGRVDNALVSYERKHPALLPYKHKVSRLITEEAHRQGHSGVATTAAKTRRQY